MDAKILKEYNETIIASLSRAGITDGLTVSGLSSILAISMHVFILEKDVAKLKDTAKAADIAAEWLESDLMQGGYECVCGANSEEKE